MYNSPRPESDHETEPSEEEDTTVNAGEWVEDRDGASLVVDRVKLRQLPEGLNLEAHDERYG